MRKLFKNLTDILAFLGILMAAWRIVQMCKDFGRYLVDRKKK